MANIILDLWLSVVILVVLVLPGYALLVISGLWTYWQGLQKLIVATGVGVAVYPVGFYALGLLPPFFRLDVYKIVLLLLFCAALVVWRSSREPAPKFQRTEWLGLAVIAITLLTRWYVAYVYPYPAWTDSLHHVLLAQLIADQGRLPVTLAPYFPVPLGMYHLGLHAITAVVMWLAHIPAHTALLWTTQTLNGLCGMGIYFVLDRCAGRAGAIVGAVTVGLLSYQPAFYVNWGRDTQVASQAVIFIAWLVTHETMVAWPVLWRTPERRVQLMWLTLLASMLSAGVFLLHFRVASMYILLIASGLLPSFWRWRRDKAALRLLIVGLVSVGLVSLLLISPALWNALRLYVESKLNPVPIQLLSADQIVQTKAAYFEFRASDLGLAGHTWLLTLTGIAAAIGLLRRNRVTILSLLWFGLLCLLGNAYLLGIPLLNVTNLSAILIMFYLPMGLICGAAVEELIRCCKLPWRNRCAALAVGGVLLLGLTAIPARVTDIEPFRYFATQPDVEAMKWIQTNTPENALFAVNSHFWLATLAHGTDAGYWIPYFTGRKITAGVMLLNLADYDYQLKILNLSRLVKRLETDPGAVDELQAQGVGYIYIGVRGNFDGAGLKAEVLEKSDKIEQVYQHDGVFIFRIKPALVLAK